MTMSRWDVMRAKRTGRLVEPPRPDRSSDIAPPAEGWNDPPAEQLSFDSEAPE